MKLVFEYGGLERSVKSIMKAGYAYCALHEDEIRAHIEKSEQ